MPLLVSDFAAGLPVDDEPPLPAAGVDVPVEDDLLELLGVVVTGALVTGAMVVAAAGVTGVGVVAPADAALSVETRAGGALTLATSMLIGGALLRATGIAMPADAAATLGGSSSAGAAAGLSARPIAKQQANTAAPASTDTSATRM
ncbi:MAG: hypothetical protein ABR992_12610 [Solirubrobacteraceae bacterium]